MFNFTRFLFMDVKMIAKPSEEDAGRAINKLGNAAMILACGIAVGIVIVALGLAGIV